MADAGVETVASAWIAEAHFGGWNHSATDAASGNYTWTPWWLNKTTGEAVGAPPGVMFVADDVR